MTPSVTAGRYIVFRRHPIFLFYATARFLFFLFACGIFGYFIWLYSEDIPDTVEYAIMFPIIFILANYAFFRLILAIVKYENKLLILADDKLVIVNCTLVLQDDIEVMNLYRIMKIDVERHGLLAMFLGYGNLIMEQQKNDVRRFHFIARPYDTLRILNDHLLKLEDQRVNMKRRAIDSVVGERLEKLPEEKE
jgi:hypothetical protein